MSKKRSILNMIFIILFLGSKGFSDVPSPVLHKSSIPFFMQPMRFQTVGMNIFSPEISGMIPDPFSDLQWNPSYILKTLNKTVYLDFNSQFGSTSTLVRYSEIPVSYYSTDQYYYSNTGIYPDWYSQSTINTIDATPHYNLGVFFPISSKFSMGLINRSLFDYAPFRSTLYWAIWVCIFLKKSIVE